MLRKRSALIAAQLSLLVLLAAPFMVQAQNTGKLTGTVVDAETGDPLPTANVVLQGTQLGTATNVDGEYTIIGVPVGSYDVRASFVGYQPVVINDVEITAGYTRELDFQLQPGQQLETVVVQYERPLIQDDAIGVPNVATSEDIENLPVRGVANIAGLQAGVVKEETSGNLYIRGGREQDVAYYVNGVKVIGAAAVPTLAVQQQEMLIGSIPARYGDVMSGVISITTKTGAPDFYGSVEGITSEALDGYGYNNVAATLGGPLFSENLTFFLSGDFSHRDVGTVRAIGFPRLNNPDLDFLRQNPEALELINNNTGEHTFIPFPGGASAIDSASVDSAITAAFANSDLSADDYSVFSNSPVNAPITFLGDQFERDVAINDPSQDITLNGNVQLSPFESIRLQVGGAYNEFSGREFSYLRALYAPERFRQQDRRTWRGFASWTQYLSDNVFYQLQASYSDYQGANYHPDFSSNVEDVLHYGDIENPANAVAARYVDYVSDPGVYVQQYSDGNLPNVQQIQGTFAAPGAGIATGFTQWHDTRFGLSAHATAQIGVHQLEFGGEYEQQTERYFNLGGTTGLARYYEDGNVEADQNLSVNSYDSLDFNILDDAVFYYGYNYLGTEEVDDQDLEGFFESGEDFNGNMAPYEPVYYAGYISDKIEYEDLVVQLGVRADVFDNNTQVLADPYALRPIVRVSDLDQQFSDSDIQGDWAPYFTEEGDIAGFRDLDGNFYEYNPETGNVLRGDPANIRNNATVQAKLDSEGNEITELTSEVFTDYEPQVVIQPRIGVSFPVTNRALFFASYDVKSQRPSQNRYDTFQQYAQAIEGSKLLNNPNLEPEKSTNYQLGFRQRLGERAALTLTGFYRQIDNLISRRIVPFVFPNNYQTYQNVDFGTVQGLEVEFDLRRTNNISLNANYTFSVAQGTGSDPQTTAQIVWQQESDPFYPRFISPLDFDQRHKLNATLDYRLGEGEGPEVMGAHPLANFGVNLVANFASGLPYTQEVSPRPIFVSAHRAPAGGVNAQNQPYTTLLNLRIDRQFDLGGSNLTAFLWIENLLNTDNVTEVYDATGLADEDGYLATSLGLDAISGVRESQGDQIAESYVDHYRQRIRTPLNYGLPRQTRLGLRLTF